MSSSRANASAVQRRTNNPSPSKQPVNNTRYQQQPQQSVQNPKLSVSDAIALTTIRLAKVETFINNLPPLDQLEAYSNQQQQQSNCMVSENVFNSIVSRLDKLEKVEQDNSLPVIQSLRGENQSLRRDLDTFRGETDLLRGETQSFRGDLDTFRGENQSFRGDLDTFRGETDLLRGDLDTFRGETELLRGDLDTFRGENQSFRGDLDTFRGEMELLRGETQSFRESQLRETKYDSITYELQKQISELKDLVLFLQNYTLKTNQKLTDIVFQQDNIQVDEHELSQHIHDLLNSEKDETVSLPITDIPEENTDNLNINI
jgi:chromosome segregation ATPase